MRFAWLSIFLFSIGSCFTSLGQNTNQELLLFLINVEQDLCKEGVPFLKPLPAEGDNALDIETTLSHGAADKEKHYSNYSYNEQQQLIYHCVKSSTNRDEMFCWSYVFEDQPLPVEMEFGSSVERESLLLKGFSETKEYIYLINYKSNDTLFFKNSEPLEFGQELTLGEAIITVDSKTETTLKSGNSNWKFTLGPNFKILTCSQSGLSLEGDDEHWIFNYNSEGQLSNATMHNSKGVLKEN